MSQIAVKEEVAREIQQLIDKKSSDQGYNTVLQLSRVERDAENYERINTFGMSLVNGSLTRDPVSGHPVIVFDQPYGGLKPLEEVQELDDGTLVLDDLRLIVFDGQDKYDSIMYTVDREYQENLWFDAMKVFSSLPDGVFSRWMTPKNLMQTWNLLYGITETKLRESTGVAPIKFDVMRVMMRDRPSVEIPHPDGWTFTVSSLGYDMQGEHTLSIDRITIDLQTVVDQIGERQFYNKGEDDVEGEFMTLSIQFIESTHRSQQVFVDNTGLEIYRFQTIKMPDSYDLSNADFVEQRVLVGRVAELAVDFVDEPGFSLYHTIDGVPRITGHRMIYNGGGFFLSLHDKRTRTAIGELSDKPLDSVWVSGSYIFRKIEAWKTKIEGMREAGAKFFREPQKRIEFANLWTIDWEEDDETGVMYVRGIGRKTD